MDDLIKALTIFRKYTNSHNPVHCEHDVLMIANVGKTQMSKEDEALIKELSFIWSDNYESWVSYRFGSA